MSAGDGKEKRQTPETDSPGACPIPITDALDLHMIPAPDIPGVVEEYLWQAAAAGYDEVRIIHGKGIGFQRRVVEGVLAGHPVVAGFGPAPADRGHWGATLARLRRGVDRSADPRD